MQVLLLQPVASLGSPGDLVNVKPGYARNYLVPLAKGIVATPNNVKQFEHQKKIAEARRLQHVDEMRTLGDKIAKCRVKFVMKAGPTGKLFGSVTNRMIAQTLSEEIGETIDRTRVIVEKPLREAGDFVLEVKLHDDVSARVKVHVEADIVDEPEPEAETSEDAATSTDSAEAVDQENDGEA